MSAVQHRRIRVSLEGNIGSGKSTLLSAIARASADLTVLQEPVDEWSRPVIGGDGMLQLFYADPARRAFAFQMFVLLSRARQAALVEEHSGGGAVLTERCTASDFELFGRPMYEAGAMDDAEWATYRGWYAHTTAGMPPMDGVVYLRTTPAVSMSRIASRRRHGEGSIDAGYIERLHATHEAWIQRVCDSGKPVLVLDGDAVGEAAIQANASRVVAFATEPLVSPSDVKQSW